jgi:NADPH:quinone reductase-like Zn-dependent oxidoreductase
LGYRTFNVVRRKELVDPLKELGADVVVTEDEEYFKEIKELTGGPKPRLGLNSVGGASVSSLIKAMGEGGTVVTIGGMTAEKVKFPTRFLIFDDIRLVGLWFDRWLRNHDRAEREALYSRVFDHFAAGTLRLPIEHAYPLEDYQHALEHNAKPRLGKVVFKPN